MQHDGPSQQHHRKTCPNNRDAQFVVVALVSVAVASASNFVDSTADSLEASARAPVTENRKYTRTCMHCR